MDRPPDQPQSLPRLRWQDEPDAVPPGEDEPPPPSPVSPGPRLARTDHVEPTPALMAALKSAFRWTVAAAIFAVLAPSALLLVPLFVVGTGYAGSAIAVVLLWIGSLVYVAARPIERVGRLWEAIRAPGFRRVAGLLHVSEHAYVRDGRHPRQRVYLPNGVTFPTTKDACVALRRAGTRVPPGELRVVREHLEGVWAVEGVAIYSETGQMLIEVTRADGTELFAEQSYRHAKRSEQKRAAT